MLDERIARFAPRKSKTVSYRETGAGPALVLLHGIGSGSAGWLFQFETLKGYRLIAWDAPGYGESENLPMEKPKPADYAQALHEFLDRLILKDVMLVASSLGCLMAGAYAAARPERVRGLILLGPAGGYAGDAARTEERLRQFDDLGAEGLAEKRAPTVVAKDSPPIALELSRWTQRRVSRDAYRRAVYCLGQGNLALDARKFQKKVLVACGTEDRITPEAGCKSIAGAYPRGEYLSLAGLGHVPHIEAPERVNEIIRGRSPI
jgi:pimeloyl-ACP methyl ester carboxylesterase